MKCPYCNLEEGFHSKSGVVHTSVYDKDFEGVAAIRETFNHNDTFCNNCKGNVNELLVQMRREAILKSQQEFDEANKKK